MANLSLRHIYKVYSNGCKAVNDFNMEIENKEFIVFVGPSGCGKSTTLRMIAGLEEISAGELYIDDVLVNDMEPKDRDISMVFQNYALYPHMTVYDNMAFGLKLRHIPQEEIHKKVLWAAKILKLTDYLDRKPRAMSGGQRQRVALGRAILRNPKVFLLDEPLSNLDAKLRTEMRAEITKLHQTLGTTFIYVTHDQVEAMTLGTRVVVMKLGYIQQIDTPQNLYNYPENKFVAGFIGTPQMNFFEAKLLRKGNVVDVDFEGCDAKFAVDFNKLIKVRPNYLKGDKKVTVGLRSENISIDPEVVSKAVNKAKVKVSHLEELGSETLVYGELNMEADGFEETNTRVVIKAYKKGEVKPGDIVEAAFDMGQAHFFDCESELSIVPRLPSDNVFDCDLTKDSIEFLGTKIMLPPAISGKQLSGCELFVPTDAISFDGDFPVKVVEVENVNKQQLIHVENNGRIFFIKSDRPVKAGEKLLIKFDIKRISVVKDGEEVVKALNNKNVFVGAYTNPQNDKKACQSIEKYYQDIAHKEVEELERDKAIEVGKLGLNDILLKEYKKQLIRDKDDAKLELSNKLGSDLGKEGKLKAKAEYKQSILLAQEQYKKNCEEFIALKNSVVADEALKAQSDEILSRYDAKIADVVALKDEIVAEFENGRKLAKDLFAGCVEEDEANYKELHQKALEQHQTNVAKIESDIASTQDEISIKALKADLKREKERFAQEENGLLTNSKTFFINVNGSYIKSEPEITKKIVQALGIAIFDSNYRFEFDIDSMYIANDGFSAKVDKILDYGEEKFILALSHGKQIVVKYSSNVKVGDEIMINFTTKGVHVYENRLDIRLY